MTAYSKLVYSKAKGFKELFDEYLKNHERPEEKIFLEMYEVAYQNWGFLEWKWKAVFKPGDTKVNFERKKDAVESFVHQFYLDFINLYDPKTGETAGRVDHLHVIFYNISHTGESENKKLSEFREQILVRMNTFLSQRHKAARGPVEKHVERARVALKEMEFTFGKEPCLERSEIFKLTLQIRENFRPREHDAAKEKTRWGVFWSGNEFAGLMELLISESRELSGNPDYLLAKSEFKDIFQELLTFTDAKTLSYSEKAFLEGEIVSSDSPVFSFDEEEAFGFLKKLDESDFRGFALEYVCKKTQEEIKVLLGLKNRQAVSAKSGKTMAKVKEYLEENPDIEGEGFVGSLISVLAKSGPFCENKSCGCYGEEASDER